VGPAKILTRGIIIIIAEFRGKMQTTPVVELAPMERMLSVSFPRGAMPMPLPARLLRVLQLSRQLHPQSMTFPACLIQHSRPP